MGEIVLPQGIVEQLLDNYEADHADMKTGGRLTGRGPLITLGGERVWRSVLKLAGLEEQMIAIQQGVPPSAERTARINENLIARFPNAAECIAKYDTFISSLRSAMSPAEQVSAPFQQDYTWDHGGD